MGSVQRLEPNGSSADNFTTGHPHAGGIPLNAINYEDCEADLRYQFVLSLSSVPSNAALVAWAGPDDCTAAAARDATTGTCWPLAAQPLYQGDSSDDGGAPITTVTLSMRDIVSQAQRSTSGVSNVAYAPATIAACAQQTQTTQDNIAIYFFFVDGQGNALGVAQAYPVTADTRAATIGADFNVQELLDSQLTVTITATPGSIDTVRYNVYCDPPLRPKRTVVGTIPLRRLDAEPTAITHRRYLSRLTGAADAADAASAADVTDAADATDATHVVLDASDDAATSSSADSGAADSGALTVVDSGGPQPTTDDAGGLVAGPLSTAPASRRSEGARPRASSRQGADRSGRRARRRSPRRTARSRPSRPRLGRPSTSAARSRSTSPRVISAGRPPLTAQPSPFRASRTATSTTSPSRRWTASGTSGR